MLLDAEMTARRNTLSTKEAAGAGDVRLRCLPRVVTKRHATCQEIGIGVAMANRVEGAPVGVGSDGSIYGPAGGGAGVAFKVSPNEHAVRAMTFTRHNRCALSRTLFRQRRGFVVRL
jgi:hypothetical protein